MLAGVWTWVRLPPAPLYLKKGGGTEIDRQSLGFVVPAPRG